MTEKLHQQIETEILTIGLDRKTNEYHQKSINDLSHPD